MLVKKVIIPAAGYGTRMLPGTKTTPKEMLPILNVPAIELIVNEAIQSGMTHIIIVISHQKTAIKQHFDENKRLNDFLLAKNKQDLLELVNCDVYKKIKIDYVIQEQQLGLANAIACGQRFIDQDEPFAVILGDDIVRKCQNRPTSLSQCLDVFYQNGQNRCVIGVQQVDHRLVHNYGIIKPTNISDLEKKSFPIQDLVEKPKQDQAPSDFAILGRYVFTYNIFDYIQKTKIDKNNEYQITDSLRQMLKDHKEIYACHFDGVRHDIGNKLGYLKANIDFGLHDDEISKDLKAYICDIVSKKNGNW